MPATYDPLVTATLGADTTSWTISGIPSGYTDLRIVTNMRHTTQGAQVRLRLNNDSTQYTNLQWQQDGTSRGANNGSAPEFRFIFGTSGLSSTYFSSCAIDILSYTQAGNRVILAEGSSNFGAGSGSGTMFVGRWNNSSAVNSITWLTPTANIAAGSTVTVYGILRA